MIKKITSLILTIALTASLSGCRNNNEKKTTADENVPSYVKTDFGSDIGLKSPSIMKQNSKGQLVIYDRGHDTPIYITIDSSGKEICRVKCDFDEKFDLFTLDSKDNLYIFTQKNIYEDGTDTPKQTDIAIHVYSSQGEKIRTQELGSVQARDGGFFLARDVAVDSEENIYILSTTGEIHVFDKEGKSAKNISSNNYTAMTVGEEGDLILCSLSGWGQKKNIIEMMKVPERKIVWSKELDSQPYNIGCNKAGKYIFIHEANGIIKLDYEGNYLGRLMDFTITYPGSREKIRHIGMDGNNSIYFTFRDQPTIIKYSPSDDVSQQSVTQKKLKIYVNGKHKAETLQKAIDKFKEDHPEVSFEIRDLAVDIKSDTGNSRDAFLPRAKLLQTEMMAGLGPDLIDFNMDLPFHNYADKGMLEVLTHLFPEKNTPEGAEYYYNIINACKYKGEIYAAPLDFFFYIVGADKEVLESESIDIEEVGSNWHSFFEAARKITKDTDKDGVIDRFAFHKDSILSYCQLIPEDSIDKFVDYENRTASFDSEEFIDILNFVKGLSNENLSHPDISYVDMHRSNPGIIPIVEISIFSDMDMAYFQRIFNKKEVVYCSYPSWDEDTGTWCTVDMALGVNKQSRYKNDAVDFIKFLLRSDIQTILCGATDIMPVNKKARDILRDTWISKAKFLDHRYPITRKDTEVLDKFIGEVKEIIFIDPVIRNIMNNEVRSFISEEKSAELTAKSIQEKVTTYLNE